MVREWVPVGLYHGMPRRTAFWITRTEDQGKGDSWAVFLPFRARMTCIAVWSPRRRPKSTLLTMSEYQHSCHPGERTD
jgi:hypothetical protein